MFDSRAAAPHSGKAEKEALTYAPTHRDFREKYCDSVYNAVASFLKANKLTEVIFPDR